MSTCEPTSADELFVFAGAGVSLSAPSALPLFNWLRDDVLKQLELDRTDPTAALEAANGLAPEPFMAALRDGAMDLDGWLASTLRGVPNSVHRCLATLASDGAHVWTVNFDTLIEQADRSLRVLAWPAAPSVPADLVKPHGSLDGELIVTSDQVLRGLDASWLDRLRADVHGRTVVFVGYSGRDLDFQPVWNDVLREARQVLWFDQPDDDHPAEVADAPWRRALLHHVDRRGQLRLIPARPAPPDAPSGSRPNAGAEFVSWCASRGLVVTRDTDLTSMYDAVDVSIPALRGDRRWARAALLGTLGDAGAARRQRWHLLRFPGTRRRAVGDLVQVEMTHGTVPGRAALALLGIAPPLTSALRTARNRARRQRVSALHRRARHGAVLRATRGLPADATSTFVLLRAASVRMTGSLDESAAIATEALSRACEEGHPVRAAHAAFQRAMALTWAERLPEARSCLEHELRPFAALAANRWVAWAAHVDGQLAVREDDLERAARSVALAERLFAAEALMDGVVSARLLRLTTLRLLGDRVGFEAQLSTLRARPHGPERAWQWYGRRSPITGITARLEEAEYRRTCLGTPQAAHRMFHDMARVAWPLLAAIANLGVSRTAPDEAERVAAARTALVLSTRIGARSISLAATDELEGTVGTDRVLRFC